VVEINSGFSALAAALLPGKRLRLGDDAVGPCGKQGDFCPVAGHLGLDITQHNEKAYTLIE
jgi:ammonia channel protein AmtB